MAFYSTQDYLAAKAREGQRQMRGQTPTRSGAVHPPEHERTRMQGLLDSIPETLPGPNAFAIQAAALERERVAPRQASWGTQDTRLDQGFVRGYRREMLETNPIYTAELQRRRVTPPTDVHPALRKRAVSDPPTPPRESDCTNITDFMKAGMVESPNLKLNATPNPNSMPTFRDMIEEKKVMMDHEVRGEQEVEEKIAVFRPTPVLPTTSEFVQRPSTPAEGLQRSKSGSKMPVKTPKKSFLSKFKLSTNSRHGNAQDDDVMQTEGDEKLPVKAQAVLGESPRKQKGRVSLGASPSKIPRSPSKRKGLFSRRHTDGFEPLTADRARPSTSLGEHQRPPNTPSTTLSEGTRTTTSDRTQSSHHHKRFASKDQSEEAKKIVHHNVQGMGRSHSMRVILSNQPPTPPAKNTPPHVKATKEARELKEMQDAMKIPAFERERSPEDHEGGIITSIDLKLGSLGYRPAPTLVTKPSMYSLHASVVPEMMDPTTVEEMSARVGALDLEGFSTPAENIRRSTIAAAVYSPSVYSPEWTGDRGYTNPDVTPMLAHEDTRVSNTPSAHTKDSSSNGTIPIVYPDLAIDHPSTVDLNLKSTPQRNRDQRMSDSPLVRGRPQHLSPEVGVHNRTHSRDHLDNDNRQSLFAQHVNKDSPDRRHSTYNSPSSFSHASAMPSPLQYLPATVYKPPPKKGGGNERALHGGEADVNDNRIVERRERENEQKTEETLGPTSGLGIKTDATRTSQPKQTNGIFDTKPPLSATCANNTATLLFTSDCVDTDPRKQRSSLTSTGSGATLEQVVKLLNRLHARDSDLSTIRDEMRASNARLDQRLSAMERIGQHSPPPLTPDSMSWSREQAQDMASGGGGGGLAVARTREAGDRVSTDVAHEFYRSAQATQTQTKDGESSYEENGDSLKETGGQGSEDEVGESETLRELREQNRTLVQMVGGFAEKIQRLEEQMRVAGSGTG